MSLLRASCAVYPFPVVIKKMAGLGLVTHDILRALRRDHTGSTWRAAMALYDRKIVQTVRSLEARQKQNFHKVAGMSLQRTGDRSDGNKGFDESISEAGDETLDQDESTILSGSPPFSSLPLTASSGAKYPTLFTQEKYVAIAHMRQRHEAALMLASVTHALRSAFSQPSSTESLFHANPTSTIEKHARQIAAIATSTQWPTAAATSKVGSVCVPMPSRPLVPSATEPEEANSEAQAAAHKSRVASVERILAKSSPMQQN